MAFASRMNFYLQNGFFLFVVAREDIEMIGEIMGFICIQDYVENEINGGKLFCF
jgi:hypothetical protein